MSKRLVFLGGGGHAKVLYSSLGSSLNLEVAICDPVKPAYFCDLGLKWVNDESELDPCSDILVNGLGSLPRDAKTRKNLFQRFVASGFEFIGVADTSAILADPIYLAQGVQVMKGCIIQTNVRVGENTIINTGSQIDHDSDIGAHAHIAPGAIICGEVKIESGVHVGAGAVIIQGIHIGEDAVIGAGAIVTKNVEAGVLIYPVRSNETGKFK